MASLFPSTPSPQRVYKWSHFDLAHKPARSSPLVSPSSPTSSPVSAASRRRAQYKSRAPTTPLPSSSRRSSAVRSPTLTGGSLFFNGQPSSSPVSKDPTRDIIRERFKARCIQMAVKAREKAVKSRRYDCSPGGSLHGSDDTLMDDDDEEDDEMIMEDELFRRIMNHSNRKSIHAYRLSFAEDVGSSIDPDMEDVAAWEKELHESERSDNLPDDVTDEEIAAYAEEQAALADFQELDIDALLAYTDLEAELSEPETYPTGGMDVDIGS